MRKVNMQHVRKQKGYSLNELLFALAAITLISAGVILAAQKVFAFVRAKGTSDDIIQLAAGIRALYPTPNYTGITVSALICSDKAPKDLVNGTGACATQTLQNQWGGTVTVAAANYGAGTNNAYLITFPNLPANECTSVLGSIAPNFQKVTAGTGAGTVLKDDSAATPVVYDPSAGATACAGGSSTITLTST